MLQVQAGNVANFVGCHYFANVVKEEDEQSDERNHNSLVSHCGEKLNLFFVEDKNFLSHKFVSFEEEIPVDMLGKFIDRRAKSKFDIYWTDEWSCPLKPDCMKILSEFSSQNSSCSWDEEEIRKAIERIDCLKAVSLIGNMKEVNGAEASEIMSSLADYVAVNFSKKDILISPVFLGNQENRSKDQWLANFLAMMSHCWASEFRQATILPLEYSLQKQDLLHATFSLATQLEKATLPMRFPRNSSPLPRGVVFQENSELKDLLRNCRKSIKQGKFTRESYHHEKDELQEMMEILDSEKDRLSYY